jgi:lipoprotein-anchoring transpeptidase ErfK/SrfK
MRKIPRVLAALVAAFALCVLTACSGGEGPTLSSKKTPVSSTVSAATLTPTTKPLPGTSYFATATVPLVNVYDAPGGTTKTNEFVNPWFVNDDPRFPIRTVFLIEEQKGDWLKVLLPIRPNDSTGWIKRSDVTVTSNPFRIEVDLSDHTLEVLKNDQVIMEDKVAIGKSSTPTPVGRFYLRVLVKPPDPNTVYGPYAYGLSSHSEALLEFNGGDAEVGIHGNNDASVLGKDVSNGCIRMDNAKITQLATMLPLGTPVEVQA